MIGGTFSSGINIPDTHQIASQFILKADDGTFTGATPLAGEAPEIVINGNAALATAGDNFVVGAAIDLATQDCYNGLSIFVYQDCQYLKLEYTLKGKNTSVVDSVVTEIIEGGEWHSDMFGRDAIVSLRITPVIDGTTVSGANAGAIPADDAGFVPMVYPAGASEKVAKLYLLNS